MGASITALTALSVAFTRAKKDAPKAMDTVLGHTADQVAARMRELAPRRTGALAGAIRVISEPGRYIVGPVGISYATYQEYGTASRGEFGGAPYVIRAKNGGNLTFKINGHWITVKEVKHPGIPAHPYARPALAAYINQVPAEAVQVATDLIVKNS